MLSRSVRLLFIVTLLAARDAIAPRRTPTSRNRHNMVKCDILLAYIFAAVMTHSLFQLLAPPIRTPQFARPLALSLYMRRIRIEIKPFV